MLAKTNSCAVVGLDGYIVDVEVDILPGLPAFNIVGLPDAAVQEAKERVRSAVRNSGCDFPMKRITANLAPADFRKAGPSYDVPIAVSLLASSGQLPPVSQDAVFLGEVSLDGGIRHTNGVLPMVAVARDQGFEQAYVPHSDAEEAALVEGITVMPVRDLRSLIAHLRGDDPLEPVRQPQGGIVGALVAGAEGPSGPNGTVDPAFTGGVDLADIRGQEHAKRAIEVAAAGGHNLLMSGPPGSGKTLLARSMSSILPRMTSEEALDVTKIYSITGLLPSSSPLVTSRPFRAPHYTISSAGLVGGGRNPRPGEITLSHRGVLFLDELPEFGHTGLEVLRQPVEDKVVTISRAQGTVTYPANFMLVAAMNPCPCGYHGDPRRECTCSSSELARYRRRISGPLRDRIDLFIDVPQVDYEKLVASNRGECSADVRQRVAAAREVQERRFEGSKIVANAEMGPVEVWDHCKVDERAQGLLQAAMKQMYLSARGYHRILKLSRTIADLAGEDPIGVTHVAEALQYRPETQG